MDELDEFMTKLEDAGVLTGWSAFMKKGDCEDEEDREKVSAGILSGSAKKDENL